MDNEFIQLKGVTKRFGKNIVLNEINLTIPEGKITGIIGASGEGKSTILKLIASFYKPNKGDIFYFRRNIMKDISNIKKTFGIAIESGSFYEDLTVKENLMYFGKLYGVKNKVLDRRANGILEFIGLTEAKDVLSKNISLGMKKRLDLACALIHKPSVLILDEPTADLDVILRAHMLKIIKKINSHGTTVIFTTQLLEEVDELCDNVAILFNEKIVDEGKIDSIKKKYKAKSMDDVFKKIFPKKNRKMFHKKKKIEINFGEKKLSKTDVGENISPDKKNMENFKK